MKFWWSRKPEPEAKVFDLGTLPDDLREFYERFLIYGSTTTESVKKEYRRIVEEGKVRTLYRECEWFNARAAADGDGFEISLNIAVPCLLHFIYNNALRLPDVFPDLGSGEPEEPYRTSDDTRDLPFYLPESMSIAEALQNLPGASRPKNEDRALFATALTEIASVFCVLHEVGHVIGGHAGYLSQSFRGGGVSEFTSGRRKLCPWRLLHQVWEREADIIASAMILSFVLMDEGVRQHFTECFSLKGGDEEYPYQIFPVILFALKLLFLYMAQESSEISSWSNHPHSLVRITYVHNSLRLAASDDLGLDLKRIDELFDQATDLADQVWKKLGLRVPLLEGAESGPELAKEVERYVVKLEEAHKRLQQRYAKWSWIPDSAWKEHGH